jgi:hypothetical protein
LRDAEISEILGATQDWLLDLSVSLRQRQLSERSLQCLFGLWICERALGSTRHDGLRELAALIAQQLPPVPVSAVSSFDSKLLLLSAYIIRACGHPAFAIETYARKIAGALREQAPTLHMGARRKRDSAIPRFLAIAACAPERRSGRLNSALDGKAAARGDGRGIEAQGVIARLGHITPPDAGGSPPHRP